VAVVVLACVSVAVGDWVVVDATIVMVVDTSSLDVVPGGR
jgi:hypothetical protein